MRKRNIDWYAEKLDDMITLSRYEEAVDLWQRALSDLELSSFNDFEKLHFRIARLLLSKREMDFSATVLSAVPKDIRESSSAYDALIRHKRFLEYEIRNQAVCPPNIHPDKWWDGPHLLPLEDGEGDIPIEWVAARVVHVDRDKHFLRVRAATISPQGPVFGYLNIPQKYFEDWVEDRTFDAMQEGDFLEIVTYGAVSNDPVIEVFEERDWIDPHLPELVKDPNRFFQKTVS